MEVSMEELLQATIDEGGSDLHIRAYMPPELRVHGELMPLADESMSEEDTYRLVKEIATEEQMAEVEANGGADFALAHPDLVCGVYLDAPVLDVRTWPRENSREQGELFRVFSLNKETLATFGENPVELLREYFALGLPTLLVAGGADEIVPYEPNSKRMIEEAEKANFPLQYHIKPDCKHHPHSLEDDTRPILDFVMSLS